MMSHLQVKGGSKEGCPESVRVNVFKLHRTWEKSRLDREEPHVRRTFSRPLDHQISDDEQVVKGNSWLQPYVLHPSSRKRLIWDFCCMAALFSDLVTVPFVLAFDPAESWVSLNMAWLAMLFWSADVFASLSTGYMKGRNLVMDPHNIWCHYAKSWLFLDAGLLILDALCFFAISAQDQGSAARLGRSVRTLKLMRGFRLVRMLKMKQIIYAVQDQISTESVSILFSIVKTFFCLLMANHLVACGWYGISRTAQNGWVDKYMMLERDLAFQYTSSLHWSLTQFTPASMEVFPQNTGERLYSVLTLIMAMVCFSSFLSILTTCISQLRHLQREKSHQFWLLRQYMHDWGVSRHTQVRVTRYLEYEYKQQKQRVQDQEVVLLAMLSEPLREELKIETCCPCLAKHPFFHSTDGKARVFSNAVHTKSHAKDDAIFTVGVEATIMVFLCSGLLSYTRGESIGESEDEEQPQSDCTETLSDGQWACEPVLWTTWVHVGDLHACRESQIMAIDSAKFGVAVARQLPFWHRTRRYAEQFVVRLNQVDTDELTDLCQNLFSPEDVSVQVAESRRPSRCPEHEDLYNGGPVVEVVHKGGPVVEGQVMACSQNASEQSAP